MDVWSVTIKIRDLKLYFMTNSNWRGFFFFLRVFCAVNDIADHNCMLYIFVHACNICMRCQNDGCPVDSGFVYPLSLLSSWMCDIGHSCLYRNVIRDIFILGIQVDFFFIPVKKGRLGTVYIRMFYAIWENGLRDKVWWYSWGYVEMSYSRYTMSWCQNELAYLDD